MPLAGQAAVTAQQVSNRRIMAVAVPALATLAADPVLSLVDTAFVGRLGTVELAALGVDSAIFGFAFAVFNFLAYATTPMVARARGAGLVVESGAVVRRALTLATLLGVGFTLVLLAGSRLFIGAMQAPAEVVPAATSYLMIRAFALPAVLIITAANGAYRGFEDTRTPLYVTLAVNATNLALDPLLIFTARMGIEGAAVATLVAQWLGAGIFLVLLRRQGRIERWPSGRVTLSELAPFMRTGSVLVVRTLLLVLSLTAATAVAARIGTVEVAAHQIVSQVWFLLAMIVDALAIAAQTLIAGLLGAGDDTEAVVLARRLLRWGWWVGGGLAAAMLLVRSALGGWFSDDPSVIMEVAAVVPIMAVMQPPAAALFVLDGVFLATLSVRLLAGSTLAGFLAVVVVLGATVALGWGLLGVWWAMTAMVLGRLAVLGWAHSTRPLSL